MTKCKRAWDREVSTENIIQGTRESGRKKTKVVSYTMNDDVDIFNDDVDDSDDDVDDSDDDVDDSDDSEFRVEPSRDELRKLQRIKRRAQKEKKENEKLKEKQEKELKINQMKAIREMNLERQISQKKAAKEEKKAEKENAAREAHAFKTDLKIVKHYKTLGSCDHHQRLYSCKSILKKVVEKVETDVKSKHCQKLNDCIDALTFPQVGTISEKVVEEVFKWHKKLLQDGSLESMKQKKIIIGILSQVMDRSELNRAMEKYGETSFKVEKENAAQEANTFKTDLKIVKYYKTLGSSDHHQRLDSCKSILKKVVEKVETDVKSKHCQKLNDCIDALTFPQVGTISEKVVEEVFKWHKKLLQDGSLESMKQKKIIIGILSQVMDRSELNRAMEKYGETSYKVNDRWYNQANNDAKKFLDYGILIDYKKPNPSVNDEDEEMTTDL